MKIFFNSLAALVEKDLMGGLVVVVVDFLRIPIIKRYMEIFKFLDLLYAIIFFNSILRLI